MSIHNRFKVGEVYPFVIIQKHPSHRGKKDAAAYNMMMVLQLKCTHKDANVRIEGTLNESWSGFEFETTNGIFMANQHPVASFKDTNAGHKSRTTDISNWELKAKNDKYTQAIFLPEYVQRQFPSLARLNDTWYDAFTNLKEMAAEAGYTIEIKRSLFSNRVIVHSTGEGM